MSDATTYSRLGYLMLKKETTAGTAVYPDTAIELLSESIVVNWDFTSSETIAGNRSKNLRPILNRVGPATGTIEVLVEPYTFGHFLTGLFGEATDSTLEASTVWQHDFEPGNTLKTYTMDVKVAGEDYVERYFGVRIEGIEFSIEDNKLKATISVQAQRAFTNARVTTSANSGTALVVDQTSGITTSDTIAVLDRGNPGTALAEYTVSAVVSETTLTVSTIGVQLDVDDIVVITAQSPSYTMSNELVFSGGCTASLAAGANGVQNLTATTNVEDVSISITNDLEARWAATGTDVIDRFPANILVKGVTASGSFTQFHTDPEFLDMLRENEQATLRFDFDGVAISSASAAAATATVETDGAETIAATIDAAGEAGNDYAIIVEQGTSTLSAALSGKLITVTLASVAGNNTTTLVATAINGLSGITSSSTGTDLVTTTDNPDKINFGSGRDANETDLLRLEFPDVRFQPFNANLGNDDIVNEEISFTAYRDVNDDREVFVRLRNAEDDY